MARLLCLYLLVALLLPMGALAQAIVLKDGVRVSANEFKVEDGKIIRVLRVGATFATSVLPKAHIERLEWPSEPAELAKAREWLSQGRGADAVKLLKESKDFFSAFEDVPGSPYREVFFAYVETLSQAGHFEETVKQIPLLKALSLTEAQQFKLRVLQLDVARQTSTEYSSILAEAKSILADTVDSDVGASIWMIIADIHAKRKEWEKALMAYLRIPVFYGSQLQRVPEAELRAGQMLVRMKRFEDARAIFERLTESHKGSPIAKTAEQETAAIRGLKNEDEVEETAKSSS